jgi:predicted transcriptional regulator
MVEVKSGSIEDFFKSAQETAKEIDKGEKITPKHTIWVDINDLIELIKPQRTHLLQYLRKKRKIAFSDLLNELHKTPASLNRDLLILSKYQLVNVYKEINPGHGIKKVIEPTFLNEQLEFKAIL